MFLSFKNRAIVYPSIVEVISAKGITLFKKEYQNQCAKIDLSFLDKGTYLIKIRNSRSVLTNKFKKY